MSHLKDIHQRGFPFLIQYTINGYPRTLEFSVVESSRSVEHMKRVADLYGSRVAVWRYDTIIFSSAFLPQSSADFHRRNFERLAGTLAGTTDEVVISFAQLYKKTRKNMDWAAEKFGFTWEDATHEEKTNLVADLVSIAKSHNMQLNVCSQSAYAVSGAGEARCIDAKRLSEIAQKPIKARFKGNRPDCGCFLSRDIGAYDTCPHGCVYCYAVENRELAQKRYQDHDPDNEYLVNGGENRLPTNEIETAQLPEQLKLFDL